MVKSSKYLVLVLAIVLSASSVWLPAFRFPIAHATPSVVGTVPTGDHPLGVAYNPVSGDMYVANERANSVTVIQGSSVVATLGVGPAPVDVAYNPINHATYVTNSLLSFTCCGSVSIINSDNTVSATVINAGTYPEGIAYDPANQQLYVANRDSNTITVINGTNNVVTATLNTPGGGLNSVAYDPLNNYLYFSGINGVVSVLDGSSNTFIKTLTLSRYPFGGWAATSFNPANGDIYVTDDQTSTISVIDGSTNTLATTLNIPGGPDSIVYMPVSNTLYVQDRITNDVTILNATNNAILSRVSVGSYPWGAAYNPANAEVYVANYFSNTISVLADPEVLPTGILTDVPITITNNQQFPTPIPYQQIVNFNSSTYSSSEATNLQNIEFFYHDGSIIASWLESGNSNTATSTIYWLKLLHSIPAMGRIVVYVGFASPSTVMFDGHVVGEAPRLSPSYGQFDNGAAVFNFYDNFAGTALKSQWNTFASSGSVGDQSQVIVNNNLTLVPTVGTFYGQGTWVGSTQTPSAQASGPIATDAYIAASQPVTNFSRGACQIGCFETRFGFEDTFPSNLNQGNGLGFDIAQPAVLTISNNQYNQIFVPLPTTTMNQFNVYTVNYAVSSASFQLNYADLAGSIVNAVPAPSQHMGLFLETNYQQIPSSISWVRTRNIPSATVSTVQCPMSQPLGITFDPANSNVYVTDFGSNAVSEISSSTNTIINTITTGANPNQIVFNPFNKELYVSDSGSTTVTAIDSITGAVVATINVDPNSPTGGEYGPFWLAFNPTNKEMYVTNYNFPSSSNTVAAINSTTNTVAATITVGQDPIRLTYDPSNGFIYVADYSSGQVSVINSANSVVATINVPGNPDSVSYNAANGNIYVASNNSNDVTVISSSTNTVVATVTIGGNPFGGTYDPANGEQFVSATISDAVYAINSTTNTVTANIPANNPNLPGPYEITYDPANSFMYASDTNDNGFSPSTVTVINALNSVVTNVPVGAQPGESAYDSTNNYLYVVNHNSNSVTVINPQNSVVATITSASCTPISFDFQVNASPSSRTISQGQSTAFQVSTTLVIGAAQPLSLSVAGLPAGASSSFTPSSVSAGSGSTLFVSTSNTTSPQTYHLTISASAAGLTRSTTVTLVVAPVQETSYLTDSSFATITSFEVVFTPDHATSTLKIAATNPGTFYYNDVFQNTGNSSLTITSKINIPSSPNPVLSQAFCLKGAVPIQIYSDLARTSSVTSQANISITQPIANAQSESLTCVSSLSVKYTVPAYGLRYLTIHIEFAGKGVTGFAASAPTQYHQGYLFSETTSISALSGNIVTAVSITAAGKKATAIGGIALDTNLTPKSALVVNVLSGNTQIASANIGPDGFYFLPVPAGGPYTVQLYNPTTQRTLSSTTLQSITTNSYVGVDFQNLNPADPLIQGYILNADSRGIQGIIVQLYNHHGALIATTISNAGGWYGFRFTSPGDYTVKVQVPVGYDAGITSSSLRIRMFQVLTQDFQLVANF